MRYNKERSTLGNALTVVCVTAFNKTRSAFENDRVLIEPHLSAIVTTFLNTNGN